MAKIISVYAQTYYLKTSFSVLSTTSVNFPTPEVVGRHVYDIDIGTQSSLLNDTIST